MGEYDMDMNMIRRLAYRIRIWTALPETTANVPRIGESKRSHFRYPFLSIFFPCRGTRYFGPFEIELLAAILRLRSGTPARRNGATIAGLPAIISPALYSNSSFDSFLQFSSVRL